MDSTFGPSIENCFIGYSRIISPNDGGDIESKSWQKDKNVEFLYDGLSSLRAEQMQLTRSLEKDMQRAAENRQEYLALTEEPDTREGRGKELEEEISELRRKQLEFCF